MTTITNLAKLELVYQLEQFLSPFLNLQLDKETTLNVLTIEFCQLSVEIKHYSMKETNLILQWTFAEAYGFMKNQEQNPCNE